MAHRHSIALGVMALVCAGLYTSVEGQDTGLADSVNEAIDKGITFLKKYTEEGRSTAKVPGGSALLVGSRQSGVSQRDRALESGHQRHGLHDSRHTCRVVW